MKVQIVPGVTRTWSFRAAAVAAAFFAALGVGWSVLNDQQRDDLLGLLGFTPERRGGVIALILFMAAFAPALIMGLRALPQPALHAPEPAPAPGPDPFAAEVPDTVPADSDPGRR